MNLIMQMRMIAVSVRNTTTFRKDSNESQWLAQQARQKQLEIQQNLQQPRAQRSLFFLLFFETVYWRSAELKLIQGRELLSQPLVDHNCGVTDRDNAHGSSSLNYSLVIIKNQCGDIIWYNSFSSPISQRASLHVLAPNLCKFLELETM